MPISITLQIKTYYYYLYYENIMPILRTLTFL